MQHQFDLGQCQIHRGAVVQVEGHVLQAQFSRLLRQPLGIAAGQDRPQPARDRLACKEVAGVAIGTVDQEVVGHFCSLAVCCRAT